MNKTPCSFEVKVLAAARSGSWTDGLREHADGCASCRETLAVFPAMQRLATQVLTPTPPPFATMRLRAEFARREQLHARRDPVQIYAPVAVAVVLLAGLFWWIGAPSQDVIDLATSAWGVVTGGLGLALFLGFAMLTFVLMTEGRAR